jgi:soluble lytic murein transglycosylase
VGAFSKSRKTKKVCLLLWAACLLGSSSVSGQNLLVATQSAITTPMIAPQSIQVGLLQKGGADLLPDRVVAPGSDATGADDQISTTDNESEAGQQAAMSDDELVVLRELFLKAEDALDNGHEAKYFQLADKLKDYPLYPYLEFKWLKENLDQDSKVKAFLEQHASSRYAYILKLKWLYHLAEKRQWSTFLTFYNASSDTGLQCYYRRAQWSTGEKAAALEGAAALWAVGHSQPKVCDPLFKQLESSALFNEGLFWQRFDAAMAENNTRLARYLKRYMSKADAETAQLWLNLHRHPARYIAQLLKHKDLAQAPLMFSDAINRLANSDLNQAVALWDTNKHDFSMDSSAAGKVEKRLAMKLAYNNDASAYDRLGQLENADYSSKTRRIRVALSQQDWPRVVTAIEALGSANQEREKWQYWLARAYNEVGHPLEADQLFRDLADKRDFYGYLAADRLNRQYQLVDKPLNVSAQQIDTLKHREAFRVVHEFLELGRERDAKLQWWHAVNQLDKSEVPVAAKLAQEWQWDDIPILTIARVEYWDDVNMRFPMSYSKTINALADQYELDPVILYGLVRRESVFNKDATSPVGARGLMQLMPGTARHIAKNLHERWRGSDSLYDPAKNLEYGSYYYRKLLTQFNGNDALALAAYNAGPNRVKQWLPDEALPVDIWIETIPYRETRDYVTSVLVYAMIYQQLTQPNQLTLRDVTKKVQPSGDIALN